MQMSEQNVRHVTLIAVALYALDVALSLGNGEGAPEAAGGWEAYIRRAWRLVEEVEVLGEQFYDAQGVDPAPVPVGLGGVEEQAAEVAAEPAGLQCVHCGFRHVNRDVLAAHVREVHPEVEGGADDGDDD